MRLVGPWPHIATGKAKLFARRDSTGVTLIIQDEGDSGLDEVSIRMIGLSDAEIDAYEAAAKAFNTAMLLSLAKEAA